MVHPSNYSSRLRATTVNQHKDPTTRQSQYSGRKILPLSQTPSLTVTPGRKSIVKENTTITKVAERIATFFCDRLIEMTLDCTMTRGKTKLQGSQAPKGFQAAHASLQPNLEDSASELVKKKIIQGGITPQKSEPYLRHRLNIGTPILQQLQQNHADPLFVAHVFETQLSPQSSRSSISGTYYEKRHNATFENPDESNQLDTMLEAHLMPLMTDLCKKGSETSSVAFAEESTHKLLSAMTKFYDESISNLQMRIQELEQFHALEQTLFSLETQFSLDATKIAPKILEYVSTVQKLLDLKAALLTKQTGVHTFRHVTERRRDYYTLNLIAKKIAATQNIQELCDFYTMTQQAIKTTCPVAIEPHITHHHLLLQEATIQRSETARFNSDAALKELFLFHFGVMELNGARRAPTADELHKQVFAILQKSPLRPALCRKLF